MGRGSVGRGYSEERKATRGYLEVLEGGRGGRRAGSAERWDERPGIWSSRSTYSSESYVSALGPAAREGEKEERGRERGEKEERGTERGEKEERGTERGEKGERGRERESEEERRRERGSEEERRRERGSEEERGR